MFFFLVTGSPKFGQSKSNVSWFSQLPHSELDPCHLHTGASLVVSLLFKKEGGEKQDRSETFLTYYGWMYLFRFNEMS